MYRGLHLALMAGLAAGSYLAPPPAAAAWAIMPEESSVLFDYVRNGNPAGGRFASFAGEGIFDPAAPEAATLEVRIESASIDLGDKLESAFATSAEWFDSANHPAVVYRLLHLTPEGSDRYRAEGELTIRGRTRPIAAAVTLDISADAAHATGRLEVNRKDYLLGVGPSALFIDIGPMVTVRFDLTARPAQ